MNVTEAVTTRRSIRAFLDTPEGPVELSGSPQRLNPDRFRRLQQWQRFRSAFSWVA